MVHKKKQRMYEQPWNVLKTSGAVTMQVQGSTDPNVVRKFAATYRKALQKEKYNDNAFRRKYPKAHMSSTIEGNNVRFVMHFEEYTDLKAEDFDES